MIKVADLINRLWEAGIRVHKGYVDIRHGGVVTILLTDRGMWVHDPFTDMLWNGNHRNAGPLLPICKLQYGPDGELTLQAPYYSDDPIARWAAGILHQCPWEQYLAYLTHLGVQHELKTSYVPDLQEVVV